MKLDETNRAIIRELKDGRKAYSTISEVLGITENTVRSRVNRMLEDGILQITGLVNPEAVPDMQIVVMGVKLGSLDLEGKAKEFLKLKGVISVVVVTGRYDLIVQIATNSSEEQNLLHFFRDELSKVEGVASVETFVVYQSHNYGVPYMM
ncbi:MAG: Lrp/AsnC family transcriptional regulator [Sphaerochaetaceae bacterium]|mgnify:CR=1 FL=1|nr:Lrp/AsnC family transcriptional regulator [Sphaerochaetaceae bacterium]